MESVYRTWAQERKVGDAPEAAAPGGGWGRGTGDLCRELYTALSTAKWQAYRQISYPWRSWRQSCPLPGQIEEYALAADIANSQQRPRCPPEIFKNSPLVVLSGFVGLGEPFKNLVTFFRYMVPVIDPDTVKLATCQRILLLQYDKETGVIDFRHYSIKLQPIGVSRKIRKLMQNNQVPDLRDLKDVSDYVTKAGYGSESEADDEAATVNLASDVDKLNRASRKSAVRLQEIVRLDHVPELGRRSKQHLSFVVPGELDKNVRATAGRA